MMRGSRRVTLWKTSLFSIHQKERLVADKKIWWGKKEISCAKGNVLGADEELIGREEENSGVHPKS